MPASWKIKKQRNFLDQDDPQTLNQQYMKSEQDKNE